MTRDGTLGAKQWPVVRFAGLHADSANENATDHRREVSYEVPSTSPIVNPTHSLPTASRRLRQCALGHIPRSEETSVKYILLL
jgi:hypothetical protein